MIHVFRLFVIVLCTALPLVLNAASPQSFAIKPDGLVSFNISKTEITRLSVVGDRVSKIINQASAFEMSNHDKTGDVFFKLIEGADAAFEHGFVITEKGHTFGFSIRPVESGVGPVLVTIEGPKADATAVSTVGAVVNNDVVYSDNVTDRMTSIVKSVVKKHVLGRTPKGRNGGTVKRVSGDGWRATVRVAAAGKVGRLVRPQEFYKIGVSAVLVLNEQLRAGERTFVVVVEGR